MILGAALELIPTIQQPSKPPQITQAGDGKLALRWDAAGLQVNASTRA
jgi:hypothetical protein